MENAQSDSNIDYTSPILTVSPTKEGGVNIVVAKNYADKLYKFLESKGIECGKMEDAASREMRIYKDAAGRIRPESECTDREFHADTSLELLKGSLYKEMTLAVFGRIPETGK